MKHRVYTKKADRPANIHPCRYQPSDWNSNTQLTVGPHTLLRHRAIRNSARSRYLSQNY